MDEETWSGQNLESLAGKNDILHTKSRTCTLLELPQIELVQLSSCFDSCKI